MTKLDAGLMTSLPASDAGSAAVWGSKRINPQPQSCLCLTWSGCPSNDDDDDDYTQCCEISASKVLNNKVRARNYKLKISKITEIKTQLKPDRLFHSYKESSGVSEQSKIK